MNKENTRRLFDEFPDLFKYVEERDPIKTLMVFGFAHGDGWFDLVYKLCKDIQNELDKPGNELLKEHFMVVQVKEKFAGLRFYASRFNTAIDKLINKAEYDSYHICEVCGQPGLPRKGGWYLTLCDQCAEERDQTEVWNLKWNEEWLEQIGVKEVIK